MFDEDDCYTDSAGYRHWDEGYAKGRNDAAKRIKELEAENGKLTLLVHQLGACLEGLCDELYDKRYSPDGPASCCYDAKDTYVEYRQHDS